jgi:hypothetical protein
LSEFAFDFVPFLDSRRPSILAKVEPAKIAHSQRSGVRRVDGNGFLVQEFMQLFQTGDMPTKRFVVDREN